MPLVIKDKLILIEAKKIEFKDKKTGENVEKYKYEFLNSDNQIIVGYLSTDDYIQEVKTIEGGYQEELANEYVFKLSEYEGKTNRVLMPKS